MPHLPTDLLDVRTAAEVDADNARDITRYRAALNSGVNEALAGISRAAAAAGDLRSDAVYDVEMAEGQAGETITALLDQALHLVVAATALVRGLPE